MSWKSAEDLAEEKRIKEEVDVESDSIFTRSARNMFGGIGGIGKLFRFRKQPQPVVLVGRDITTDAQALDPTTCAAGIRAVESCTYLDPLNSTGAVALRTEADWPVGARGEVFGLAAGAVTTAGIATVAASTTAMIMEIERIAVWLQCGAAAANRTMQVNLIATPVRAWAVVNPIFASAISGAVIINQYGGIVDYANGIEDTNINGAIVGVAGRSPFPLRVELQPASNSYIQVGCAIANVNGLDTVGVSMWLRRVA